MPDSCLFLRSDSEVVIDPDDPKKEIHYLFHKCIVIEGMGDVCPFPARFCEYKQENEEPTVQKGGEVTFKDGSILKDLTEVE